MTAAAVERAVAARLYPRSGHVFAAPVHPPTRRAWSAPPPVPALSSPGGGVDQTRRTIEHEEP